jgi:hypothetical protein
MPPKKRSAPAQASSSRPSKSRKSNQGQSASAENSGSNSGAASEATAAAAAPANSRYTPHSGSANLEAEYHLQTRDKDKAYSYICLCRPFLKTASSGEDDDDDDDDEDEEDEDEDGEGGNACDGGETCICLKSADDHPDHPWVVTKAGQIKLNQMHIQADLRCPDNFQMYTFNDHEAYGMMQVFQNLILDYEDAGRDKDWKGQWAMCEATAKLGKYASDGPMCM